ncbi:GNAT family N-acetyltransferase [Pseudoduganella chitinolytica]|uniref:GNAT family N-acetyltransferase n=1 Tax=Pseudoduganella chitinolytica TaxID=34070 RepID=A0ABY8BGK2_9BURK|nr:GNAT family N-acetyltransferase [Pseudoduganella chitinolytica]WEF34108.1 GNAT family N-acetyltransferase [Pseudoduganella chitinolytica]
MLALLRAVCAEGDALPFTEGIDERLIASQWLAAPGCVLAWAEDRLLGMYRFGANMPGRGAHVATATFLVSREARGHGLGRRMVTHCLEAATAAGFDAMQFNQVLKTNTAALALYRSLGFRRVGRIPRAFRHAQLGLVDAYILYRPLA